MLVEWSVDGNNIRLRKQCLKVNLFITFLRRSTGGGVVNDFRSKCTCNLSNTSADCPKTDDPPGFSMDFYDMLCKMSERDIIYIALFFHIIIIIAQLF